MNPDERLVQARLTVLDIHDALLRLVVMHSPRDVRDLPDYELRLRHLLGRLVRLAEACEAPPCEHGRRPGYGCCS